MARYDAGPSAPANSSTSSSCWLLPGHRLRCAVGVGLADPIHRHTPSLVEARLVDGVYRPDRAAHGTLSSGDFAGAAGRRSSSAWRRCTDPVPRRHRSKSIPVRWTATCRRAWRPPGYRGWPSPSRAAPRCSSHYRWATKRRSTQFAATAALLTGPERAQAWSAILAARPNHRIAQQPAGGREYGLFELRPEPSRPPPPPPAHKLRDHKMMSG